MTTENIKAVLDACYRAKRIREMLPPLPEGVASSHIRCLDTVERLEAQGKSVKISDIADAMNLPLPGVTRTVKEMCEKGLLEKSASPHDGRVAHIVATDTGRRLKQIYTDSYFTQLAPLLADITDDDARCMVKTIDEIYDIMSERRVSLERR